MVTFSEIQGYYGASKNACTIFVCEYSGDSWYCIEGSQNVNCYAGTLEDGVYVETLEDHDMFGNGEEIETMAQFEAEMLDYLGLNEEEEEEEPKAPISRFEIVIDDFDNAAMIDDTKEEVLRILRGIIANIENNGLLNCEGLYLKDINGNTVGNCNVVSNG